MKKHLLLLVVFALTGAFSKSFCQPLPDENKFYSIVNKATNQILVLQKEFLPGIYPELSSKIQPPQSGTRIILQTWKFVRIGSSGFLYFIQMKGSDNTIDIPEATHNIGSHIILHKLNDADNQKFFMVSTGEPNTFYISSFSSGLVLDGTLSPQGTAHVNFIKQMGLNGSDNQKWLIEAFN